MKDTHRHQLRENVLFKFIRCIFESLKRILIIHRGGKFLDNVPDQFDAEFVKSVRSVLHIIKLFLPLPIYWALLAQQDSSWTFQATKMNTKIGQWHIEPDQMKAIAPLILLALIPLWDRIVLPAVHQFTHFDINPVASITLGGISAAAAFICAGFLEVAIQVGLELFLVGKLYFYCLLYLSSAIDNFDFHFGFMATPSIYVVDDRRAALGHSRHPIRLQASATINEISRDGRLVH